MVLHLLLDQFDPNLTIIIVAMIGVVGVLGSGFVGPVVISMMNNRQRAIERAQDRADRAAVAAAAALAVASSASVAAAVTENKVILQDVAKTNAARSLKRDAQLATITRTTLSTHGIVNSQRTVMLRTIAGLARRLAKDHPEDLELAKAANDAEFDLAVNIKQNADALTDTSLTG